MKRNFNRGISIFFARDRSEKRVLCGAIPMNKASLKAARSRALVPALAIAIGLFPAPASRAMDGEPDSECIAGELGLLRLPTEEAGAIFGYAICTYGDRAAIAAAWGGKRGQIYVYRYAEELLPEVVLEPAGPPLPSEGGFVNLACGDRVIAATDHGTRLHFFSETDSGWVESFFSTGDWSVADMQALSDGRIAVGAPDFGGGDVGGVLLFEREGDIWRQTTLLRPPHAYVGEYFGQSLAIAGELLVVASDRGLYVYRKEGGGFILDQRIPLIELNTRDLDGIDIVADETQIIVYFDVYFRDGILVFGRNATGWNLVQTIDGSGKLTLAGPWLAAAAPWFPDGLKRFGKVDLYSRDGTGWRLVDQISRDGEQVRDEFGFAVAFLDNRLLIGVPGLDAEQNRVGAVVQRVLTADCNDSGIADSCEIGQRFSEDCNTNGIPDECEAVEDCNANGRQDICDGPSGAAEDCNEDGVPDECIGLTDCDADGVPNPCAIESGAPDCQNNGVPDSCDIASRDSLDVNSDSIPDECQPELCLQPICVEGPCAWMKAVAINGKAIASTSCVRASPGNVIDVELWWSDWATALPTGADVYQMTLNAPKSAISATSGTVLPLGSHEPMQPIFCSNEIACPADYPVCAIDECHGENHNPALGISLDPKRADFIFAGQVVYVADFGTRLSNLTYFAVADTDSGRIDPGVPTYAGSLKLVVSEDACGIFRYEFDGGPSSTTMLLGDYEAPPVQLIPLTIIAPVCDCNGDGVFDWEAIRSGVSIDCNGNGKPDDCDIAEGSPDVNGDGIPDHCKRSRAREMDE